MASSSHELVTSTKYLYWKHSHRSLPPSPLPQLFLYLLPPRFSFRFSLMAFSASIRSSNTRLCSGARFQAVSGCGFCRECRPKVHRSRPRTGRFALDSQTLDNGASVGSHEPGVATSGTRFILGASRKLHFYSRKATFNASLSHRPVSSRVSGTTRERTAFPDKKNRTCRTCFLRGGTWIRYTYGILGKNPRSSAENGWSRVIDTSISNVFGIGGRTSRAGSRTEVIDINRRDIFGGGFCASWGTSRRASGVRNATGTNQNCAFGGIVHWTGRNGRRTGGIVCWTGYFTRSRLWPDRLGVGICVARSQFGRHNRSARN